MTLKFLELLRIPRNSYKFALVFSNSQKLQRQFPSNLELLGIPRNSQKFPKILTDAFTHSQVFPEIPRFLIFAHLHVLD